MNIRLIIPTLRNALKGLVYDSVYNSNQTGSSSYTASNLTELRNVISELESFNFLTPYIEELKKTSLFSKINDSITFNSSEDSIIKSVISQLRSGIRMLINYFETTDNAHPSEDDALIKMPDFKTFEELETLSKELKLSIELSLNISKIEHDVQILSSENGSIWFQVSFGTIAAVRFISWLFSLGQEARKRKYQADMFEQYSRALKNNNDFLEPLLKATSENLEAQLKQDAKKVLETENITTEQAQQQIEFAIKTLAKLQDLGLKVLPFSTNAEIVENFSDKGSTLLNDAQKLLSSSKS